jgi:hypothetical protein
MAESPNSKTQDAGALAVPSPAGATQATASPSAALLALLGNDESAMVSWDPRTPEGGYLLQKCEEDQDDRVRQKVGEVINVANIYAKLIPEYTNKQTGEVYPLLRICLITTDQDVLGTAANGVRESLLRLIMRHGAPPWPKGVPCKIRQTALPGEKIRLWLEDQTVLPKKPGGRS